MTTEKDDRPVVLCVDDSEEILELLEHTLKPDYRVLRAQDAEGALKAARGEPRPDLVLLDVEMPGASGLELCRTLKTEPATATLPIIFLTARTEAEAQVEGLEAGAVDYVSKPLNRPILRARVHTHLALADRRRELERLVLERTAQLERTRVELIRRLARAMEFHESAAVGNRVMRLSHYAKLMAQAAGARPEAADMMMKAAPLHDVGKLAVPAEILRKRAKLTVPDWERVKRHPQLGAAIIGEHDDPLLKLARQIALTHHEHWDGSGYPQGLKGEAIPWSGRAMAIVDAFESMTCTQFYRDAISAEKARDEIVRGAGTKYDPKLIEAFQRAFPAMVKVRETFSDQLGDLINLDFSAGRAPRP